jgi:hypothetical protein
MATDWTASFQFPAGARIFFSATFSKPTQPPDVYKALFLWKHEADSFHEV